MTNYWLRKVKLKKGLLSKQLHIPEKENIKFEELKRVIKTKIGNKVRIRSNSITVTPLLKKRSVLALTLKRMGKK